VAATPAGRQGRPRPRPGPGRPAAGHRRPARGRGGAGRGRDPWQPAALGPRHLDRPRHPPAGHDPGTNRRRTIFGAIDLASGRFCYQVCRKAVSASFTGCCEQLLAAYPAAPQLAVVCDNVIIHRSKLVQRWLAAHPRMLVLHGARYSPHDNRPSGSGRRSRRGWQLSNPDHPGRVRQVHAFFHPGSAARKHTILRIGPLSRKNEHVNLRVVCPHHRSSQRIPLRPASRGARARVQHPRRRPWHSTRLPAKTAGQRA
jgi:hypothetical protein